MSKRKRKIKGLPILFLTLAAILFYSVSFAAEGCVKTSSTIMPNSTSSLNVIKKYNIRVTCTAGADGSINENNTLTASDMALVDGSFLYKVTVQPGGTAPTDASDLAITDSRSLSLMTAAGNGLDLVDATSTTQEYPEGPNTDDFQMLHKAYPLTFVITNNSVNAAIVIIDLEAAEQL
jgi:hypothetical protein